MFLLIHLTILTQIVINMQFKQVPLSTSSLWTYKNYTRVLKRYVKSVHYICFISNHDNGKAKMHHCTSTN